MKVSQLKISSRIMILLVSSFPVKGDWDFDPNDFRSGYQEKYVTSNKLPEISIFDHCLVECKYKETTINFSCVAGCADNMIWKNNFWGKRVYTYPKSNSNCFKIYNKSVG